MIPLTNWRTHCQSWMQIFHVKEMAIRVVFSRFWYVHFMSVRFVNNETVWVFMVGIDTERHISSVCRRLVLRKAYGPKCLVCRGHRHAEKGMEGSDNEDAH